jgi:hypothetical protein
LEHNEAEITPYDGGNIMAVLIDGRINSRAVKATFQIKDTRFNVINPILKKNYQSFNYQLQHTIGIYSSDLFVVRTVIRKSNNLVWVGRAANHGAKFRSLISEYRTRITPEVNEN